MVYFFLKASFFQRLKKPSSDDIMNIAPKIFTGAFLSMSNSARKVSLGSCNKVSRPNKKNIIDKPRIT